MKTFEVTYSIKTTDDSDIDLTALERDLGYYSSTDMNLLEIELVEPAEVHVTFETRAESIRDIDDVLDALNDEDVVDDPELYDSERISHTSY